MLQDKTKQKVYEKFDGLRKLIVDELRTEVAGREIVDILRRATIETKAVINNQYYDEEQKYLEHDMEILVDIFRSSKTVSKSSEDRTNRLDKTISDVGYVLDCLRLLRDIESTGDCNICKNKRRCMFEPEVGQMVRYNCPFYNKGEEK